MSISIVINNYNYGRFLGEAIRSALEQSIAALEVIVVDDGSTDNSRDVIESFGSQIHPIYQLNGGQAAAFNSGIRAAKGDWVWLLDADDVLKPNALEIGTGLICPGVSRIAMGLQNIDASGKPLGCQIPNLGRAFTGPLHEAILQQGSLIGIPTSGNLFRRDALNAILPVPEKKFRICADAYLYVMTALYGTLRAESAIVGDYRIHGDNNYNQFLTKGDNKNGITKQLANAIRLRELLEIYGDTLSIPLKNRLTSFWHQDQMISLIFQAKLIGIQMAELRQWPWWRLLCSYFSILCSSILPLKRRIILLKQFAKYSITLLRSDFIYCKFRF
jgi:glycosyltransferase involved in cell wall biosynthesis